MTSSDTSMFDLCNYFKDAPSNLIHITSKCHALDPVARTIGKCYPYVNELINETTAVRFKYPK